MRGVNRPLWTDPGDVEHLISTYRWIWTLMEKVLTLSYWWQGRIPFPFELIVMLRLLNLPDTLLWRTCCLEWCDECDLVEGLSLPFGHNHWKMCLFQESGWRFLEYNFPLLQLRASLLILIWMASLSSVATCLLSWSISLKWKMLAFGWFWKWCVCKLHWWHDYRVLSFYFPNSAGFLYVRKVAIFI